MRPRQTLDNLTLAVALYWLLYLRLHRRLLCWAYRGCIRLQKVPRLLSTKPNAHTELAVSGYIRLNETLKHAQRKRRIDPMLSVNGMSGTPTCRDSWQRLLRNQDRYASSHAEYNELS